MEDIEAGITKLRQTILKRYENDVLFTKAQIVKDTKVRCQELDVMKNALIKELDDRLALIKEFPSVLDADVVAVREVENRENDDLWIRVERYGEELAKLDRSGKKWKILILAKKIE